MPRRLLVCALFALTACLPEIRIGAKEGIPPIDGSTEIATEALVCGEPIAAGTGTVTTRKVPEGCELTYTENIQVIDEPDYQQISELTSLSGLLEAVELELTEFSFVDAATNTPLDTEKQISSATLALNGQWVADKGVLTSLPRILRLSGPALQPLKDAITQRQPASIRLDAVVVLFDDPPPPRRLRFEYRAQPTLVLGGSL